MHCCVIPFTPSLSLFIYDFVSGVDLLVRIWNILSRNDIFKFIFDASLNYRVKDMSVHITEEKIFIFPCHIPQIFTAVFICQTEEEKSGNCNGADERRTQVGERWSVKMHYGPLGHCLVKNSATNIAVYSSGSLCFEHIVTVCLCVCFQWFTRERGWRGRGNTHFQSLGSPTQVILDIFCFLIKYKADKVSSYNTSCFKVFQQMFTIVNIFSSLHFFCINYV